VVARRQQRRVLDRRRRLSASAACRREPIRANVASHRVLERTGFQREGVARAGYGYPLTGERIDCLMWSLLPGELER
jgi:hypothetical protein